MSTNNKLAVVTGAGSGVGQTVTLMLAERGWDVPVGWDRDGAVSNVYRVGLCPTLALAFPGGILQTAEIGTDAFAEPALSEALDRLVSESAERERVH